MTFSTQHPASRLAIPILAVIVVATISADAQNATTAPGAAQGQPQGQPGGAGVGMDSTRTLIVAENPSIEHRAQPGGAMGSPTVTTANFWRVSWSPAGPGAACFIIVNDPQPAAQKFVITDNPKLADYISSKEVLARLIPAWNDPPFTVIDGTITQKTDGTAGRTETCRGGNYTVELKWTGGLSEPRWIDFPFARKFGVIMTLSAVNSKQQEIVINGKRAPGQYASGFLALNETWRVEK